MSTCSYSRVCVRVRGSGNLEAAIELGAYAGLQLTWVPLWAAVLGFCLQDLASRIGLASGQDLAQLVRERYPRWCVRSLYVCLELAVVAADIQEVIGTAIALNLLFGLPLWMGSLFTAALSMALLFLHAAQSRLFEALIALALCTTSTCAVAMMFFGGVDGGKLLKGLVVPSAPPGSALIVVGTIGATVMPHNIFLGSRLLLDKRTESDAEQQDHQHLQQQDQHRHQQQQQHAAAKSQEPAACASSDGARGVGARVLPPSWHRLINFSRCELAFALVVSLVCNCGLISTFSRSAYSPSCIGGAEPLACIAKGVSSPGDGGAACMIQQIHVAGHCGTIDLQNAGPSLEASMPRALGAGAKALWAIGLFFAGQASTLTCTCAGQASAAAPCPRDLSRPQPRACLVTATPPPTFLFLWRPDWRPLTGDHGWDAAAEDRAVDTCTRHSHGRPRARACYRALRVLGRSQV
jgi:NRAMP (natural resistance-associated macrophage protein)-like metal ion transporter